MMGQRSAGQKQLFYSFNLDDHIPADHLLRGIARYLDLSELRRHLASLLATSSYWQRLRRICDEWRSGWRR